MELKELSIAEIEERKSAIKEEANVEGADLDALEAEVRNLNAELESRKAQAKADAEKRDAIAKGTEPVTVIEEKVEERKMDVKEVRNSKEYLNAYAEYIKTGKDEECRALLTTNADAIEGSSNSVAIPDMVYDIVKTAWDKEGIVRRVKKAYVAGNLKVGFELSATGAVIHKEGTDAPTEEQLVLGTVLIVPEFVKKWITVSDEVMAMRGEAFLRYVYEELAYRIAKKIADEIIADIKALGTSATSSSVSVPVVVATQISIGLISKAVSKLSDEATKPIVMMNKETWAEFKAVQYANKFATDPFEGLEVEFNNTITPFADATTGVPYVIVGDLEQGALMNLPEGEGIRFTFDENSLSEKDLVKIVGKEYMGLGIVADKAFVKIMKEEATA